MLVLGSGELQKKHSKAPRNWVPLLNRGMKPPIREWNSVFDTGRGIVSHPEVAENQYPNDRFDASLTYIHHQRCNAHM